MAGIDKSDEISNPGNTSHRAPIQDWPDTQLSYCLLGAIALFYYFFFRAELTRELIITGLCVLPVVLLQYSWSSSTVERVYKIRTTYPFRVTSFSDMIWLYWPTSILLMLMPILGPLKVGSWWLVSNVLYYNCNEMLRRRSIREFGDPDNAVFKMENPNATTADYIRLLIVVLVIALGSFMDAIFPEFGRYFQSKYDWLKLHYATLAPVYILVFISLSLMLEKFRMLVHIKWPRLTA